VCFERMFGGIVETSRLKERFCGPAKRGGERVDGEASSPGERMSLISSVESVEAWLDLLVYSL
jgi:hypothetical protein